MLPYRFAIIVSLTVVKRYGRNEEYKKGGNHRREIRAVNERLDPGMKGMKNDTQHHGDCDRAEKRFSD